MISPHFTLVGDKATKSSDIEDLFSRLLTIIEYLWKRSDVSSEFQNCLRQALPLNKTKIDIDKSSNRWVLLPGLCCSAAGGINSEADYIAGAWLAFYIAAHIMDSVQDKHIPEGLDISKDPSHMLNIASGLFFTAELLLDEFISKYHNQVWGAEIIRNFHTGLMNMCQGQYLDVRSGVDSSLQSFWQISKLKSGMFFATACKSGAAVVSQDEGQLACYYQFGYNLGILIQVLDELEDWYKFSETDKRASGNSFNKSLPILYTKTVLQGDHKNDFEQELSNFCQSLDNRDDIVRMVDQSGAALYILTEIERYSQLALKALEPLIEKNLAKSTLVFLIEGLLDKNI